MKSRSKARRIRRRGKVVVLVAVMMPILAGMGAFAIDVGHIVLSRARLQTAAEAAALVSVEQLPDTSAAVSQAQHLAQINFQDAHPNLVASQDVEFGTWEDGVFTAAAVEDANAVRVTARLSQANGNQLSLFFGNFLGLSASDISASAVAMRPQGTGTRFLIDEDMFDKDVPAIEALAASLGRDPEELVTARGFNLGKTYGASNWTWEDNFLDIPGGSRLFLPTGQATDYDNNDSGMFRVDYPSFPFTDDQSFEDFLFYSETGGDTSKWGTDSSYIYNQLDPLYGASPVVDGSQYPSFVSSDYVHVSPIFPSDINTLNQSNGTPQLNAKGLRRGLLAFKIVSVGSDPDGSGSVLPELEIEVVDPANVDQDDMGLYGTAGGGGPARLVQ